MPLLKICAQGGVISTRCRVLLRKSPLLTACGIPNDSLKSRRAYAAYMDLRYQFVALNKLGAEEKADWKHNRTKARLNTQRKIIPVLWTM